MTHTLVASATRQHIIGFDRPFTVIGERINPTGRKKLAAEMQAGKPPLPPERGAFRRMFRRRR